MLTGPIADPTRKPLTEAQAKLWQALEKARRVESKLSDDLDALDDQYLRKTREKLTKAKEESQAALLAVAKALKEHGHRYTPTNEPLEVSVDWKPAERSFVQPSWRDTKETTTYAIVIGAGKEAIKLTAKEVNEASVESLGIKPAIKTIDPAKVIDAKATAAAATAKAKALAATDKPAKAKKPKAKK